jgi:hypothetical protein
MSHFGFGSNKAMGLVLLLAMATGLSAPSFAQVASFDVRQERQAYYASLQAHEQQLVGKYNLKYDFDGKIIQDENWQKAATEYKQFEANHRAQFKQDSRRDQHWTDIVNQAGVKPDNWTDTGTPPGHKQYRAGHSDRDITVASVKDVNAIVDAAKAKNYNVQCDPGKVYIKELDVTVWDPDTITLPGGEKLAKGKSLSQQVADLHDAEVVLNPEAPGVAQQVKKAAKHLNVPPPSDPTEQARYVQELAKSGYKAQKTVGFTANQDTFEKLKAGGDPTDILYPFGASKTQKSQAIGQFRDQTVTEALKLSLKADQANRQYALAQRENFVKTMDRQLEIIKKSGVTPQLEVINHRLQTVKAEIARIKKVQMGEELTLTVVQKKCPAFATTPGVTHETAAGLSVGKAVKIQTGLSAVGALLGLYTDYNNEAASATAEGRNISYGKIGTNSVLNLTGINNAVNAGSELWRATHEGTTDYIQEQLAAYASAGYDTDKFGVKLIIFMKASIRGTVLGSYAGAKGLPLLGDVLSGVENASNLMAASVGLAHDLRAMYATMEQNKLQQADTLEQAMANARLLAAELQALVARIRTDEQALGKLAQQTQKIHENLPVFRQALDEDIAQINLLNQRIVAMQQFTTGSGSASLTTELVGEYQAVGQGLETPLRMAGGLVAKKESANATTIQSMREVLGRAIADGEARFAQANTKLRGVADLVQARQIQSIQRTLRARATANLQGMQSLAQALPNAAEYFQKLHIESMANRARFADVKGRLLRGIDFFVAKKTNPTEVRQLTNMANAAQAIRLDPSVLDATSERQRIGRLVASLGRFLDQELPPDEDLSVVLTRAEKAGPLNGPLQTAVANAEATLAMARERMAQLNEMHPTQTTVIQKTKDEATQGTGSIGKLNDWMRKGAGGKISE